MVVAEMKMTAALIRSGKKDEAYIVFKSLSGELKHEAERLLK